MLRRCVGSSVAIQALASTVMFRDMISRCLALIGLLGCSTGEGSKREWGFLQELEARYRTQPLLDESEIVQRDEYWFLCVASLGTAATDMDHIEC